MFRTRLRARLLAALALVIAVASATTACGGSSGSQNSSPGVSGTIRFLAHSTIQAPMTAVIENFEKAYPGVKVNPQFMPPGQPYLQGLTTQLRGSNAPDVFYTNAGPSSNGSASLIPLAKAGKVTDLANPAWAQLIPEEARSLYYVDGKLYGIPIFESPLAVIYNVDEFKKLGLQPATTWQSMVDLCAKAKAAGKAAIALPGQAGVILPLQIAGSTVYAQTPDWNAKRAAGNVTFAGTPGWREALSRVVEMNNAGCFQPGVAGASVPAALQVVASGQAPMFVGPVNAMGAIAAQAKGATFAAFPLPGDAVESTRAMVQYSPALAISASSPNQAAAKAFIDFVGSPEQAALVAKVSGTISLQQAKDGSLPDALSAFTPFFQANKVTSYAPDGWDGGGPLNTAMNPSISGLLTGQLTPDEILKSMDEQWGK